MAIGRHFASLEPHRSTDSQEEKASKPEPYGLKALPARHFASRRVAGLGLGGSARVARRAGALPAVGRLSTGGGLLSMG